MRTIVWSCDPQNRIGRIEDAIYGGFVEHLGRNVYGGVWDPDSPYADENGFRSDVLSLIRELNMPVTRYPGGNFVGLFRWEDGIGPRSERHAKMDLAWHQLEPNLFGLDEFMKWARKAETRPVITLNIANRSLMDTAALYEYCNIRRGTYWSDQRRKNGAEEPYGVHYWCLGNELYGSYELGTKTAEEYGRLAREHAKVLRRYDPDCCLIVCGNPADMAWNRIVLELCGEFVDCLSLHDVFCPKGKTEQEYLRYPDEFEHAVAEAENLCRAVRRLHPSCRDISISVDEWIIWDFDKRMRKGEEWTTGMHLLEQDYTIREALIAGELFSIFHRHADTVKIACLAQSINVLAPIRTEQGGCWKQSIFHPFALTSRYGRGCSLHMEESGNDDGSLFGSMVWNDSDELVVFAVNRSEKVRKLEIRCRAVTEVLDGVCVTQEDHDAVNSPERDLFVPRKIEGVSALPGVAVAKLPPFSWNMIRLKGKY